MSKFADALEQKQWKFFVLKSSDLKNVKFYVKNVNPDLWKYNPTRSRQLMFSLLVNFMNIDNIPFFSAEI